MKRRDFLKLTAAGAAAAFIAEPSNSTGGPLPKRPLGKTGQKLSIIGFGGLVVVGMDQSDADKTVSEAIEKGVNYFDVAPSYGNGEAEEKLGAALVGKRDKVFLACKTGKRDAAGATRELERSLKRLRTDHFDLYQLHALTTLDEVEKALAPGGAVEALREAQKKGMIRYIGFSAHTVEAALAAIERFDFDTILFPINWVCEFQGNFGHQVVEKALSKRMGILAIKAMARGPWPRGAKREYPGCWYQPCSDPEEASLALRYTLSQPITAAVPPGDVRLFKMAMGIAQRFTKITPSEMQTLKERSKGIQPIFTYPSQQEVKK
ncbi:MAG: aldo/keto reductase [Armatimonadota bacterium]|nr:aldo/keto reductase [Armatimonadota bacterium]